jgi:RND family efflux transporter MFP subunit
MKKMRFMMLLPVLAAGLHGCRRAETPVAGPPAAAAAVRETVRGELAAVAEHSFPRYLRATGQLRAATDAVVAADAMGRVVTVAVERGSVVQAGDVLAELDARQAKLALEEAAASLALAESKLGLARNEQERNRPLAEKRAVAESDYQKLVTQVAAGVAEVAAAKSRRDQAQKALDDCRIRTVSAGVVAERMVEPGEYVRTDSPVARVVDLTKLRLVLSVPETEVGLLALDQVVTFQTPAVAGRTFRGSLRFLGAALREASRDLVVEAEVENAEGVLRPGFFCDAGILLKEEKAVAVPDDALRSEGSRRVVFVVGSDARLEERLVETGEIAGGFTEIRRGIAVGERVLRKPGAAAADGAPFAADAPKP